MPRAAAPLLLAQPTRFAALGRPAARVVLALVAALLLASLAALSTPDPAATSRPASSQTDIGLYTGIVGEVRHGASYYPAAAAALRAGNYPLRPFVTFRLPTLAVAQAALPEWVVVALLYLLGAATVAAWTARLSPALPRPPARIAAILLLAGGSIACWQAALAPFHEVWAGLLMALSLAVRRPGRWGDAVAWGLAAALVRETAVLYLVIMAALAWRDGARREAAGWLAAVAVVAMALAAHAIAVARVVGPLDPASPGWAGLLGVGFVVRTWAVSTALSLLPLALAAPLVALALVGWAAWRDPLATRALATLAAYAAVLATAGRADTFYWGLLTAPVLLVGLVFAPDGLRDLLAAALDRRRITVRRVVR